MSPAVSPAVSPGMSFLHRNRIWFAVGLALAVALVVSAWLSAGKQEHPDDLDPQNPDPQGAQALAQVLGREGVEVDIVRSADALHDAGVDADTTVLVTGTDQLAPSTVERLRSDAATADVVLVQPPHAVLKVLQNGAGPDVAAQSSSGSCSDDRFDQLTLTVDAAEAYRTSTGCFPSNGGFVLARGPGQVTYLGAGQALTNDQVLRGDNAAVALRLLGAHDRLVWYLPTYEDASADEAVSLWSFAPGWLVPGLWLVGLTVVATMLWRGRRLGRLAVEPLPVVVRAVETTRSRGRMYRQADDRGYAADALRAAARRRLAEHLRLGRGATESDVVTAVARQVGRREDEITRLLAHDAPVPDHDPADDQALVGLAQALTELMREVRRG